MAYDLNICSVVENQASTLIKPKSVIRISQCCMAVRNPLAFPISKGTIVLSSTT